jgi:hypothetical protein
MLVLTGNLWVGTWNDGDSVLWAPDTSEYVGLWYGGERDPEANYGPNVSITVGNEPIDDNLGSGWADGLQINLDVDDKNWHFAADGNLTLPQGSSINDNASAPDGQAIEITPGGASNVNQLLKIYPTVVNPDGNHLHLTSGDLSVTDLFLGDDDQFVQIAADGNVCIGTYGTSGNIWQFGTNGNITFPDSTTQSTAFNITKFGEGFSLNGADKIVTNKLYSTNASSPTQHYRLELDTNGVVVLPDQSIINGSTIRGIYGTGELNYTGITIGPDTNHREESWVWVDHTGVSIATEYSTDAYTWKFDNNGSLTLPGGSAIGYTPAVSTNITVNAKTWAFGVDGNLTIPGEIKSAAGVGNVAVQSNDGNNTYNWTFETNGNLTFPDSTTQSTAYKRTTSSWNVAVGSATYNFTVPLNGTYSMWVKGNIPDGIIVWNATATVTNNNVPVVGQQYAWNYTGGGTPIEITAMPTQFVGTGNTIVSSNPSVGSNANVFNFTINNTSGAAKTVYWGYVAQ